MSRGGGIRASDDLDPELPHRLPERDNVGGVPDVVGAGLGRMSIKV
jgi:hypothetical protein